ncbi:MAG: hypothetical protein JRN37_04695 [Nitrososphaerota archaeon]|nr:hypothetical protein [Nitrososphaerota archaeon]MDG7040969.1 hypothetical protein [Nitrososphaerota archaeon]
MDPKGKEYVLQNATCFKCAHMATCLVFRDMQSIQAQFPPTEDGKETAPFKADEAAKICVYYAPPTVSEAWTK